jgi:hypothetical protein
VLKKNYTHGETYPRVKLKLVPWFDESDVVADVQNGDYIPKLKVPETSILGYQPYNQASVVMFQPAKLLDLVMHS